MQLRLPLRCSHVEISAYRVSAPLFKTPGIYSVYGWEIFNFLSKFNGVFSPHTGIDLMHCLSSACIKNLHSFWGSDEAEQESRREF